MKKLLIIEAGKAVVNLNDKQVNFTEMIINKAGLKKDDVISTPAYKNEELVAPDKISGAIITGSASMVTEEAEWILRTSKWLKEAVKVGIPILGICFGHQLLAKTFGGEVDYHPQGKEIGTVDIQLTEAGKKDQLLSLLPQKFLAHVIHDQTVISLPERAKRLASNDFESNHAFVLFDNLWGVQFHPEFNAEIISDYIKKYENKLIEAGRDIDEIFNSVQEINYGKRLLEGFVELLKENN